MAATGSTAIKGSTAVDATAEAILVRAAEIMRAIGRQVGVRRQLADSERTDAMSNLGPQASQDWMRTASILSEGLTHIRRHGGRIVVIKIGGAAMASDDALAAFALDVTLLRQCGVRVVVVHGGGPQISGMLKQLALPARFVDGQRVTDSGTMKVVEMVLSGSVNKRIVAEIQKQGGRAVGLSGKDGNLLLADRRKGRDGADIGLVGQPSETDPDILERLVAADYIPVMAPVARGRTDETLNVNADAAAGAVAAALKAARLLLLTDVEGVLDRDGALLPYLTAEGARRMIEDGTVDGGMIPKIHTACEAVANGVRAAVILDGRNMHATLLELFTDRGAGTLISLAPL